MRPQEVLNIWSCACEKSGVKWYLYRETLLCAHGYRKFPDELQSAQVAVFAKDIHSVVDNVFSQLPADWGLDMVSFALEGKALCFQLNGMTVLEVDVLSPVEGYAQMGALKRFLRVKCAKPRRKARNTKIRNFLIGKKNADKKAYQKPAQEIFRQTLSLMDRLEEDQAYFCDCFTQKGDTLIRQELVTDALLTLEDGTVYPVFTGYETYLADVYGDYEIGLSDAVGCGLTAEEKIELQAHQARCREALAFVQKLSEDFGLRYYLLAGSVLGAVRDGGFIPWDDDVDLGIRIEDLAHFEEVVKEQLPQRLPHGFKLVQSAPDHPYPRMFSKICYNGRCCIDLWPLVPTYEKGLRATFTWYFAKIITRVHYHKIGHSIKSLVKAVRLIGCFLNDRQVMALARFNERKYQRRNTPAYINLYSIYRREKETISRRWLDTEATADFDGLTVPVVGCTEEYLTHLYGDYMRHPAPWKRASRHIARF